MKASGDRIACEKCGNGAVMNDYYEFEPFDADCVIVERAERHLYYLAEHAPIIPAPLVTLPFEVPADDSQNMDETTLAQTENGPYTVLSGVLDSRIENDDACIYIEVLGADGKTTTYLASLVTVPADEEAGVEASDYGYEIYLPHEVVPVNATLRVIAATDDALLGVKAF